MCPRTGAEPAWVTAHRDAVGWPATLSRARDAGGEPWGGTESVICSTVGALRRVPQNARQARRLRHLSPVGRRVQWVHPVPAPPDPPAAGAAEPRRGSARRVQAQPASRGTTRIGGHATVERLAVARHLCLPLRRRQHVRRRSQRLRPSARGPVMTAARTSAQNAAMEALLEAHATELKLPTVKARFRAMATEATREQQTLRPRPTASDSATAARAQREHFRHHQQPTTTDARWGHFKRRRWGHCK